MLVNAKHASSNWAQDCFFWENTLSVPAVRSPIFVNRSAGKALGLNSLLSPPSPCILVLSRLFFIPHSRAFLKVIMSMMSLKRNTELEN